MTESTPTESRPAKPPSWLKLYAFSLALLVPMDWFAPTAAIMREFGGKPAIPVLTVGGILGLLSTARLRGTNGRVEFTTLTLFAAWLALGFGAALLNFGLGWSGFNFLRSPLTQLINQSLLVVTAAIAVVGNSRLARAYPLVSQVARYIPYCAAIQMIVFGVEAAGLVSDSDLPLSLFRAGSPETIERPTGLFSEPSFFGTFAGLYGAALLTLPAKGVRRLVYVGLAALMGVCAVLIGAKTVVVVAGTQALFFMMRRAHSLTAKFSAIVGLLLVGGAMLFFMQRYAVLDVEANLSSADRLGSAVLAANVARDGYALPGVGFGQFHFFYRKEFAPNFLYLSREARTQLTPQAENRASTYNFYLRVLVETGIAGFALLVVAFWKLWYANLPRDATYLSMLFAGALGFLLTQDTYFYPPLVFSAAMIVSLMQEQRARQTAAVPGALA